MKKILIISTLSIVILFLLSVGGTYAYYQSQVKKNIEIPADKKVTLTIKRGTSVNEIASYLKEQGLISNELILPAYLYLNRGKSIQAG